MLYINRIIFLLFITWIVSGCLIEENINLLYESYLPEQLGDGWQVSTPADEGFDQQKTDNVMRSVYDQDDYPNLHSLLIARHGQLVAEGYTKDKKEQNIPHNLVSATKSITSLLTGIAIDKGYIHSLDETVFQFIPEYFDDDIRKREITIHHVLTMETGLDFDNDVDTNDMFNYSGSSLKFVLHKKLLFLPGTSWYYGDGNPQLISGIIQKVTGNPEEQFAAEYLFTPLGITDFRWEKHADGLSYGAKGLWLRPRDMVKIGQLMLQQGEWQDQQIVSAEWIRISTQLRSTHQQYGYYWYPEKNFNAYYAEGHGGQIIWIAPDLDLVIVITSDPYAKTYLLSESYSPIFDGIINAISQ